MEHRQFVLLVVFCALALDQMLLTAVSEPGIRLIPVENGSVQSHCFRIF